MKKFDYLREQITIHGVSNPDCMEWPFARDSRGYGKLQDQDGKIRRAHQVSYRLVFGEPSEGLEIDHTCRNKPCFNPAHLEAVTTEVNLNRRVGWPQWSECPKGHSFSIPENVYVTPNGRRNCRVCRRDRMAAWEKANRRSATAVPNSN